MNLSKADGWKKYFFFLIGHRIEGVFVPTDLASIGSEKPKWFLFLLFGGLDGHQPGDRLVAAH